MDIMDGWVGGQVGGWIDRYNGWVVSWLGG